MSSDSVSSCWLLVCLNENYWWLLILFLHGNISIYMMVMFNFLSNREVDIFIDKTLFWLWGSGQENLLGLFKLSCPLVLWIFPLVSVFYTKAATILTFLFQVSLWTSLIWTKIRSEHPYVSSDSCWWDICILWNVRNQFRSWILDTTTHVSTWLHVGMW